MNKLFPYTSLQCITRLNRTARKPPKSEFLLFKGKKMKPIALKTQGKDYLNIIFSNLLDFLDHNLITSLLHSTTTALKASISCILKTTPKLLKLFHFSDKLKSLFSSLAGMINVYYLLLTYFSRANILNTENYALVRYSFFSKKSLDFDKISDQSPLWFNCTYASHGIKF